MHPTQLSSLTSLFVVSMIFLGACGGGSGGNLPPPGDASIDVATSGGDAGTIRDGAVPTGDRPASNADAQVPTCPARATGELNVVFPQGRSPNADGGTVDAGVPLLPILRASVSDTGTQADNHSFRASLSRDGTILVFASDATNITPADTNNFTDIFIKDLICNVTIRLTGANGQNANGPSTSPSISADGRYVVFTSDATNFVSDDRNRQTDVFLFDRATGDIQRVSVGPDGVDGDQSSFGDPVLSADGRFVAFGSFATNLVIGDTNRRRDIFVFDRVTNRTERISSGFDGAQTNHDSVIPTISADGNLVGFISAASNVVAGDTNRNPDAGAFVSGVDAFVRDRAADTTRRVSVTSSGAQSAAGVGGSQLAMSSDGHYVAFDALARDLHTGDASDPSLLEDIFEHDLRTNTTTVVNPSIGAFAVSIPLSYSDDGRFLAFQSDGSFSSTDFNTDRSAFVRDRQTGLFHVLDASRDGRNAGQSYISTDVTFSGNGRYAAFRSNVPNLVEGDTNMVRPMTGGVEPGFDIFVVELPR